MNLELASLINDCWENRGRLSEAKVKEAILETMDLLDCGTIRVAQPGPGGWTVNECIKKAILLYFGVQSMAELEAGPFHYHDKIPLKDRNRMLGVRAIPGSIIRKGAFAEKGVILMPSFVNIGAYVGEGSMVDTWATVGSCAQVGKRVHLSGGVGLGGVLEPPQAAPVIVEDDCFVGSRCIVVEGVRVEEGAVLGANVVLTASTRIIDVSRSPAVEFSGRIPARSVVIPGTREKVFPGGTYQIPCALIIGTRKKSTDEKTSLNEALREFSVPV